VNRRTTVRLQRYLVNPATGHARIVQRAGTSLLSLRFDVR